MGRPLRTAQGDLIYHVLNRANDRKTIFHEASDYGAFERLMSEVQERVQMRILGWCLMPNHWHLVLWPMRTYFWRGSANPYGQSRGLY